MTQILDYRGNPVKAQKSFSTNTLTQLRMGLPASGVSNIRKSYAFHSWHYAAVTAITSPISSLDRVLSKRGDVDEEPIVESDILDLLEDPNPMMDGPDLWEATLLGLLLPSLTTPGGQCFWVGMDSFGRVSDFGKGEVPEEIYVFTDNVVKPIAGADNILKGWKVQVPGFDSLDLELSQVLRFHFTNPFDYTKGLSPWSAAALSIDQDLKADALNLAFFANGAHLGGTLTTDKTLRDDQLKSLEAQWMAKYSGAEAGGRTAILHSGLKFDSFAQTHTDMQFKEQKELNRDEILAVYRVPKIAVSQYDNINFATANAAMRLFWENTLLPLDKRVNKIINNKWLKYTREQVKLFSDLSRVSALQETYTDVTTNLVKLVEIGVPVNIAKQLFKMPLATDDLPWLDTVYVKRELINIQDIPEGGIQPAPTTTTAPKDPPITTDESKAITGFDKVIDDARSMEQAEREAQEWREGYIKEVTNPIEKRYTKAFIQFLNEQKKLVLEALDKWAASLGKASELPKLKPSDYLPAKAEQNKKLRKVSKPYFDEQAEATEKFVSQFIAVGDWGVENENVQRYLEARLLALAEINNTTYTYVKEGMEAAMEAARGGNITLQGYAKGLKKVISNRYTMRTHQAKTVARTELGGISSNVSMDAYRESGITKVRWVAELRNTRHTHITNNGTVRKLGKKFPNGMAYPYEPGAPASEVINCQCMLQALE